MTGKLNRSAVLYFLAGCVLVVLPAFLSGYQSERDKDAATYLKLGNIDYDDGRYREWAPSVRRHISELSEQ